MASPATALSLTLRAVGPAPSSNAGGSFTSVTVIVTMIPSMPLFPSFTFT